MKIWLSGVLWYNLCFHFVRGNVYDTDKPCAAQSVPGQSVICVCNATYCDTITRRQPTSDTYVAYTSSEDGLRFRKTSGKVLYSSQKRYKSATILELDPFTLYQEIIGFGGAPTDSAGINWKSLKDSRLRQHLVNSYCSKSGLEYNLLRLPMAGTDFSTRPYTYNECPGDYKLSQFNLAPEDYDNKIPLIKACMDVATSPIKILGSMWSPPIWMKTSNSISTGYLKSQYFQTLANYFIKFLENYQAFDIPIWGVTITNEPLSRTMFNSTINKLEWTISDMGKWIVNNLGPTLRKSKFKNTKILACDDQRFTIPLWFNVLIALHPAAVDYLDGVAIHAYFDDITPPSQITMSLKNYPDKFALSTEACFGSTSPPNEKVVLGSWSRAEFYASNIIENLNYNVAGWIDWNLCLNESGGPNWIDNRVDSPIIVSAEKQEFYKQPMFYVMGHFSKFVPRGSRRCQVTQMGDNPDVQNVAFVTPKNTIVVILFNKGTRSKIVLKFDGQSAILDLKSKSITTVEFKCNL